MIDFKHKIAVIKHFFVSYDIEYIEMMSGMLALFWGIILLLPFDTFSSTPSYFAMQTIAPEIAWGLAVAIGGMAQMISVLFLSNYARKLTAGISIFIWWFVAGMFIVSNSISTAVPVYSIIALSSSWSFIRLLQRHN